MAVTTLDQAVGRVLLGESLSQLAECYREELLEEVGLEVEEARPSAFLGETTKFMNRLCRRLGDAHAGDHRVSAALVDWVRRTSEYDAFDSLLSAFDRFEERDRIMQRGRALFPGALTAHWDSAW